MGDSWQHDVQPPNLLTKSEEIKPESERKGGMGMGGDGDGGGGLFFKPDRFVLRRKDFAVALL